MSQNKFLFENFFTFAVAHFEALFAPNIDHLCSSDLIIIYVEIVRRCFHFFAHNFSFTKLGTAIVDHFAAPVGPFAVFTIGLAGCERNCSNKDEENFEIHLFRWRWRGSVDG